MQIEVFRHVVGLFKRETGRIAIIINKNKTVFLQSQENKAAIDNKIFYIVIELNLSWCSDRADNVLFIEINWRIMATNRSYNGQQTHLPKF